MDFLEILSLVFPIMGFIIFCVVAHGKIPFLSPIAKFIWNISCLIASYIPFVGWIGAKLMIVDSESEAMAQKSALEISDAADEWGSELASKSLQRNREEQRRIEEEAALERQISQRTGRTARIHGNTVDIGDKTYDLNKIKKELKIQ